MFLCVSEGDERAIRPWDSTTKSWGELVDWDTRNEELREYNIP